MKDGFRKSMRWFHTWASLVFGWLLLFMFLTGAIGYFEKELTRWMEPELPMAPMNFTSQQLAKIGVSYLQKEAPSSSKWKVFLPSSRDNKLRAFYYPVSENGKTAMGGHRGPKATKKTIDPYTKEAIEPRETGGGSRLYRMHYTLQYVDARTTGRYIVGFAAMLMLVGLLTGIVIHINIFKDFFTFRQDKNLRSWLDAHIVTGVLALPFHIMITYSGLAFFIFMYMPGTSLVNYEGKMRNYIMEAFPSEKPIEITGISKPLTDIAPVVQKAENHFGASITSLTIVNPGDSSSVIKVERKNSTIMGGDKIDKLYFSGTSGEIIDSLYPNKAEASNARSILTGLHIGRFSDTFTRWLYFLSSILGSVMVASGLVIWTKKREKKQSDTLGFKLVDSLNIATIAGLPVAIAAYFWANRLLPIDMLKRADMEVDIMFLTWLAMTIVAFAIKSRKAWFVQFYLAGWLYALLPLSNFFLTDRSLLTTLAHGDWVLFWADISFIVTGIAFWIAGKKVHNKIRKTASQKEKTKGEAPLIKEHISQGSPA